VPGREGPVVTAFNTTVSWYRMMIDELACFAKKPVSIDNTPSPIFRSTLIFTCHLPYFSNFVIPISMQPTSQKAFIRQWELRLRSHNMTFLIRAIDGLAATNSDDSTKIEIAGAYRPRC
jgi:hypothetical protein